VIIATLSVCRRDLSVGMRRRQSKGSEGPSCEQTSGWQSASVKQTSRTPRRLAAQTPALRATAGPELVSSRTTMSRLPLRGQRGMVICCICFCSLSFNLCASCGRSKFAQATTPSGSQVPLEDDGRHGGGVHLADLGDQDGPVDAAQKARHLELSIRHL